MDEEGEATQETLMQHILHGSSNFENLIRPAKCSIGDRIIKGEYPEVGSPSSSQVIGLGETLSNGFSVPTTAPTTTTTLPGSGTVTGSVSGAVAGSGTGSVAVPLSGASSSSMSLSLPPVKTEALKTVGGKKRPKGKVVAVTGAGTGTGTPPSKKLKRSNGR